MADYRNAVLCKNGRKLLKLAASGEAKIIFSSIKTSTTKYEVNQLGGLIDIGEIKQSNKISASIEDSLNTVSLYTTFSNVSLIEGYFIRNFGIYAIDPEDKNGETEILYAIVNADETINQAVFIPAYNSGGTSGVDFTCEIVVDNSNNIIVKLDENNGVPASIFNDFVERFNINIQGVNDKLSEIDALLNSMTVKRDLLIPASGWTTGAEDAPDGTLHIDISQEDVVEDMVPLISIQPTYAGVAKDAGIIPSCRTMQGKIRLYAETVPKSEIVATLTLLQASSSPAGSGGSSGAVDGDYVLPIATATRLGGVKIGEGVNVEPDCKIHVDGASLLDDATTTEGEVEEMLNEVFGSSEAGTEGN